MTPSPFDGTPTPHRFVEIQPPPIERPNEVLDAFRKFLTEECEACGFVLLTNEEYKLLLQRARKR